MIRNGAGETLGEAERPRDRSPARRLICGFLAIVLVAMALWGCSGESRGPGLWLMAGEAAYDHNRFTEATTAFVRVLSDSNDTGQIRRSAELLISILLDRADADGVGLVRNNQTLDDGLTSVVEAARAGDVSRAAESVAFLAHRDEQISRASRRLLAALEDRLGPVDKQYVRGWEREVGNATDVAVDAVGRAWLLVAEPPAFVQVDGAGRVVKSLPFVPPESLDQTQLRSAPFAARGDGGFQVGGTRYTPRGARREERSGYPPVDVAETSSGLLLSLHPDGLRALGADDVVVWQRLGRGRRDGSFEHPRALAVAGDGLVVAESSRLQRFDMKGEFLAALRHTDADASPGTVRLRGINDVAVAGDRLFLGYLNATTVGVLTQDLRPVATINMAARRIAASPNGLVFGLKRGLLSAALRVPERSPEPTGPAVAQLPGDQNQTSGSGKGGKRGRRTSAVSFVPLTRLPDYVRVHVSTRHATSLAVTDGAEVWIGTYGGLLHGAINEDQTGWRHWTRMDGFPADVVHDVHETADGAVWVILNGAVLVRRANETAWHRLERDGVAVNGKHVTGDLARPGYVWIAAQRGLLHLNATAGEAGFVSLQRGAEEAVQIGDGRVFVRLGVSGLAAVDPAAGTSRVLVEMEDLKRTAGLGNTSRDRWIMSAAADPVANVLWLGTDTRELFAVDLDTETLNGRWIDGAIHPSCREGEIRAKRTGKTLHVLGNGCYAVLRDDQSLRLIAEHPGSRGQDVVAIDDAHLLATTDGLFAVRDGRVRKVARAPNEPPDWAPRSILAVDQRIWVGFGNRGVGVYDGRRWRELEQASSVDRLRLDQKAVLAIASYGRGGAFRISRDTRSVQPLAPGGGSWTYMRDLFADGEAWWGVGAPRQDRANGIRVWRNQKEEHWGRSAGMPFGQARRIVPDPADRGVLWLATDTGLVRLAKQNRSAEVVWPGNVTWLDHLGGSVLWAYTGELLRYDTRTGVGSTFPISGIPARHPNNPDRLWIVHRDRLVLADESTGHVISEIPIGLGDLTPYGVEVGPSASGGLSAWIAAPQGLLEIDILQ